MKKKLALQPRRQLSRSEAWGCFTANLSLPGAGSLVAGRAVGYAQLIVAAIGFGFFTVAGLRFIAWYLENWKNLNDSGADFVSSFEAIGRALRWPLIGGGIVLFALLWALFTSLEILRASPKDSNSLPPRLS